MLNFLVLGDLHSDFGAIQRIVHIVKMHEDEIQLNAVLITGDFTTFNCQQPSKNTKEISIATMVSMEAHLRLFKVPVLCVPGNHDTPDLWGVKGCITSIDSLNSSPPFEIGGVRLIGFGGSWRLGHFPYEWDDNQELTLRLKENLPTLNNTPEIFLSHVPPIDCGVGNVNTGEIVGSQVLKNLIEERKPLINICGHIHEAAGWGILGSTYVLNAGAISTVKSICSGHPPWGTPFSYAIDCWSSAHFTLLKMNLEEGIHEATQFFDGPRGWESRVFKLKSGKIEQVCSPSNVR